MTVMDGRHAVSRLPGCRLRPYVVKRFIISYGSDMRFEWVEVSRHFTLAGAYKARHRLNRAAGRTD